MATLSINPQYASILACINKAKNKFKNNFSQIDLITKRKQLLTQQLASNSTESHTALIDTESSFLIERARAAAVIKTTLYMNKYENTLKTVSLLKDKAISA